MTIMFFDIVADDKSASIVCGTARKCSVMKNLKEEEENYGSKLFACQMFCSNHH